MQKVRAKAPCIDLCLSSLYGTVLVECEIFLTKGALWCGTYFVCLLRLSCVCVPFVGHRCRSAWQLGALHQSQLRAELRHSEMVRFYLSLLLRPKNDDSFFLGARIEFICQGRSKEESSICKSNFASFLSLWALADIQKSHLNELFTNAGRVTIWRYVTLGTTVLQ